MFKKIVERFEYLSTVPEDGLYTVTIIARCESGSQLGTRGGEDLLVEIDGRQLREVPPLDKPQYQDIPSTWNGTRLKGLKKTIVFFLVLTKGDHKLVFTATPTAVLEYEPIINSVINGTHIELPFKDVAEDGDRRPWYTFVFIDLPIKSFFADITTRFRGIDSDDVKLIVDGMIQKNTSSILHKNWLWSGSLFNKLLGRERQVKTFEEALLQGTHYIELWADRTPTLHTVSFDLGKAIFKRIPTVDDPRWTGIFEDDPEEILLARLIFGEARNQPHEARAWIAGSILNRVHARAWPNTIHGVILQSRQYDPFKPSDRNYEYVIDPFKDHKKVDQEVWRESYTIAQDILSGKLRNPTEATHFHGLGVTRERFMSIIGSEGKFLRTIGDTSFYWAPH